MQKTSKKSGRKVCKRSSEQLGKVCRRRSKRLGQRECKKVRNELSKNYTRKVPRN